MQNIHALKEIKEGNGNRVRKKQSVHKEMEGGVRIELEKFRFVHTEETKGGRKIGLVTKNSFMRI